MPTRDECIIYLVLASTSFVFDRVMVVNIWLVITICRYSRHDKRSKLPGWILSHLRDAHLNLSTDMALHIAREVCPHSFVLKFCSNLHYIIGIWLKLYGPSCFRF
jgi:hypothetical protein